MSTAKEENKTTPAATKKQAANKTTPATEKAPEVKAEQAKDPVTETQEVIKEQKIPAANPAPEVEKEETETQKPEKDLKGKTPDLSIEEILADSLTAYHEAIEVYFNETGELPLKGRKSSDIYEEAQRIKENKQIAEMQRLEILEANKPKTFAVTDGKTTINVTEKTFKYLGKEWKKSPTEPKEVQELKKQ